MVEAGDRRGPVETRGRAPARAAVLGAALRASRAVALGGLAGVTALGGCEIVIDGKLDSVHCLDEGMQGPPACPEGSSCVRGVCVPGAPAIGLGLPCDFDGDCGGNGFCLDPTEHGGTGPKLCSFGCCSSGDCGQARDGFVCWVPEQGPGAYCMPAARLYRVKQLGGGKAGDPCLSDSGCRSGLCSKGACADTCCSDTNCGDTDKCFLSNALVADGLSWACGGAPAVASDYLGDCVVDADCFSGLCLSIGDKMLCSKPCCDSEACGSLPTGELVRCQEVVHQGAVVHGCSGLLPATAKAALLATCAADDDCRSGMCLKANAADATGICTDVCCADRDCVDAAYGCRPYAFGSDIALRCEPL